jgi:hypothetical protein
VRTLPKVRRPELQLASLVPEAKKTGRRMKFYVKHADGELMFPSFKDFQSMYRLKFIAPTDMVRRENSERWMKAADLPELRLTHSQTHGQGRRFTQAIWLLLGVAVLVVMFQMFMRLKPITHAMQNDPTVTKQK